MIALTQARNDPRAQAFLASRRAEGKSSREAMRALKRRLSDVVYRQLLADATRQITTVLLDIGAHRLRQVRFSAGHAQPAQALRLHTSALGMAVVSKRDRADA